MLFGNMAIEPVPPTESHVVGSTVEVIRLDQRVEVSLIGVRGIRRQDQVGHRIDCAFPVSAPPLPSW